MAELASEPLILAQATDAEDAAGEAAPAAPPADTAPVDEAPAEAEAAPDEDAPAEDAPAAEAPTVDAPAEAVPAEVAPVEEAPVEAAPVEPAPVEPVPADEAPSEAAPAADEAAEQPAILEGVEGAVVAPAAEGDLHATTETADHAADIGMPQLNVETFAPQIVWLAVTFVVLYLLMSKLALPRIARIMAARQTKMDEDIDRAERLKKDADEALAAYNRSIAEARTKAQEELRAATAEAAALAAEREAAFAAKMKERLDEATRSIESAKTAAIGELKTVASDVAGAVTAKLGGGEVPPDRVAAAVDQAMSQRPGA